MNMSGHNHFSEDPGELKVLLITVSTTRTGEDDSTGLKAYELAKAIGFQPERMVVRDDDREILLSVLGNIEKYDFFVLMGGTGLSKYDLTVQTVRKIADKEVAGFGELFRSRSENKFAYLSNASMFSYRKKLIFCLPGSPDAQETGFSVIKDLVFHASHEVKRE